MQEFKVQTRFTIKELTISVITMILVGLLMYFSCTLNDMNIIFNISKIKIQHPFFFWKAVKIQCFQILRNSYHEISLVV